MPRPGTWGTRGCWSPRTWVTPGGRPLPTQVSRLSLKRGRVWRCLRGCGQNHPRALGFPGGFPGRACSVWWGTPRRKLLPPLQVVLTLAQGCARDVSGDCDITGGDGQRRGSWGPLAGPGPG